MVSLLSITYNFILKSVLLGVPCSQDGTILPSGSSPEPEHPDSGTKPFKDAAHFKLAHFLLKEAQMSFGNIDKLMSIWREISTDGSSPYKDHKDILSTVDSCQSNFVPWQTAYFNYPNEKEEGCSSWKNATYTVHYQDPCLLVKQILANPELKDCIDWSPYKEYKRENRLYSNFMSGEWAWKEAVCPFSKFFFRNKLTLIHRIKYLNCLTVKEQL